MYFNTKNITIITKYVNILIEGGVGLLSIIIERKLVLSLSLKFELTKLLIVYDGAY